MLKLTTNGRPKRLSDTTLFKPFECFYERFELRRYTSVGKVIKKSANHRPKKAHTGLGFVCWAVPLELAKSRLMV